MRIYNKLVRDNIPKIISENGQSAHISILDDEQYGDGLRRKLTEETQEYLESESVEELADIIEVIEALAVFKGSSLEEVMKIKREKADKNGKFEKRIFLEKVDN